MLLTFGASLDNTIFNLSISPFLTVGENLFQWPDENTILNEGELIRLTDQNNNEVDRVDLSDIVSMHGPAGNYSYEFFELFNTSNDNPAFWRLSTISGGTPGISLSPPDITTYGCTDPSANNCSLECLQCGSGGSVNCTDDCSCNYNILGDMNGDGELNLLDIVILINMLLGSEVPRANADMNFDGDEGGGVRLFQYNLTRIE